MDHNNYREQPNKILSILKLLALAMIIIAVPLYFYLYKGDLISNLKNPDNIVAVADFIKEYKTESIFIYLGLQIAQIIISVLPGQVFQMAAGYIYGTLFGIILSLIGAALGSALAYFLAYFLGRDAIRLFIKPDTLDTWVTRLNSKKAYIVIFLLYLIPGLPKDMISYPAGIARVNFKAFIVMSLLGRLPAMSASVLIGAMYEQKNYYVMGAVAIISVIIFLICVIKRKSISKYMDRFYEKVNK